MYRSSLYADDQIHSADQGCKFIEVVGRAFWKINTLAECCALMAHIPVLQTDKLRSLHRQDRFPHLERNRTPLGSGFQRAASPRNTDFHTSPSRGNVVAPLCNQIRVWFQIAGVRREVVRVISVELRQAADRRYAVE